MLRNRVYDPLNHKRWSVWKWQDIDRDGRLYLRRLRILDTPLLGIKLHWFHAPDPDDELHDHPWAFVAFVLRGWYREWVPGDIREVRWFNFHRATDAHRISLIAGRPITLVFTGPRVRSWGFHTTNGWVGWREFLGVAPRDEKNPETPTL